MLNLKGRHLQWSLETGLSNSGNLDIFNIHEVYYPVYSSNHFGIEKKQVENGCWLIDYLSSLKSEGGRGNPDLNTIKSSLIWWSNLWNVDFRNWNFESLELWDFETNKPRKQNTDKPRNQETKKPGNLSPTHQHTDSHPCTSRPLGEQEGTWETRVSGIQTERY